MTYRKFKNPLDFKRLSLVPAKKDKGYYDALTKKEAQKLLRQPDRRTLIGRRDYAILRLMVTYGLRIGEVCKLKYQDLVTERGHVLAIGLHNWCFYPLGFDLGMIAMLLSLELVVDLDR